MLKITIVLFIVVSKSAESQLFVQNAPNPFNPSTNISFSVPGRQLVQLKVYNAIGQEVTTLVNKVMNSGNYSVPFDATNFSSGIYFYKLQAGNFSEVKKMVLTK